MATDQRARNLGFKTPGPNDLIRDGDDAISQNARAAVDLFDRTIITYDNLSGTATTLPAGSPATVTVTGTLPNKVINVGIPKGEPGMGYEEGQQLVAAAEQSASDAQTALQAQFLTQDEGVAALIETAAGPQTRAALDATTARGTTRAGAGSYTQGDVITLGRFAFNTRADTGTSVVAGGGSGGQENVIGGNLANVDTATSNLTGVPTLTGENGNWNFLLGGYDTVVNGWANIVHGYHAKVGLDANHNVMGGGSRHTFQPGAAYGTIGGGTMNEASGANATIAGGNTNKALANHATIAGGKTNTASGNTATIGGGNANTASEANATVAGGNANTASGNSATVVGGLTNEATATGATVIGGRDNAASGTYSVATGRGAVAAENGQTAHSAGPFATPGDAQINAWHLKAQTTGATAADLTTITGAPPTLPEYATWAFTATIAARRTDVEGDAAAFEIKGCLTRNAGSSTTILGTPTVTPLGASASATGWTVAVSSYSVGMLRLTVTGETGKTIRWSAHLQAAHVKSST